MSPEARQLLREVASRREWQEILTEISDKPIPAYKPSRSVDSKILPRENQIDNWILESGRALERERIVKLLTGESQK